MGSVRDYGMSHKKKKSQPMSLRIEQTIADRLSAFCEQSGQSKTIAIERAIVAYIDDYESMMKWVGKTDTYGGGRRAPQNVN